MKALPFDFTNISSPAVDEACQSILDSFPAHTAIVDTDGVILAVNKAWRQFGVQNGLDSSVNMVGLNYLSICDAADGPDADFSARFAAGLRAVLAGKKTTMEMEYPCHAPDERRWFCGKISRLTKTGKRPSAIIMHENVTGRVLEKFQKVEIKGQYEALLQEIKDAIFICDLSGQILYANQAACRSLGYESAELQQMNMAGVDPYRYGRLQQKEELQLALNKQTLFETIHITKSGKVIPVETSVCYFKYNQQITCLYITRDISQHKQTLAAEQQLRTLNEALINVVGIINESLDINLILRRVLENIGQVVKHDEARIYLFEDSLAQFEGINETDIYLNGNLSKINSTSPEASPVLFYQLDNNQSTDSASPSKFPNGSSNPAAPAKQGSQLGVPLSSHGQVFGMIKLNSQKLNAFSDKDAEYLKLFADQVALAIKNARLFARVAHDNTELISLVESNAWHILRQKEQLESIITNSADKILLLDKRGRITLANPKFYDTFGLSTESVIGRLATVILPIQETTELASRLHTVMYKNISTSMEAIATLPNQHQIDLEIRLAPVKSETSASGCVCTIRNTTHFKQVARAKDAFVSNVSHELRTPITSLTLYQQLLEDNPDKISTYLPTLKRETKRLSQLVEDLLSLSRLDQNRYALNRVPVDLKLLVTNLVTDRQSIAREHNIILEIGEQGSLPELNLDAGLIEQAIGILISNALNFTPSGGRVWIDTLLHWHDEKEWCRISVCDTGPGIQPEEQSKIFERFYQGKIGEDTQNSGTGLGLSLAAEIVKRHQGIIEVQSTGINGEGSIFTLLLPI